MRIYLLLLIMLFSSVSIAQVPFQKGVNLTNWFQSTSPNQIQFSKFTKKDFENIKSLGCDVIRLPINLHAMTDGAPNYTLDPLFVNFLDQVVDWAEELEMHLIIDNHTFDPVVETDPAIEDVLVKIWPQVAAQYSNRSEHIYYEVLNEPHGISNEAWGAIQQKVIDAIRSEDVEHYIIVGGTNYNSYTTLADLPVYDDDKIIYTFHFYDPFIFTHQGASWGEPSMANLTGVPFPYKASAMPHIPNDLKGTWVEGALNNYANDGTIAKVKQLLDIAIDFKTTHEVPVFCGEFGVYMPNSDNSERVVWYEIVRSYLEEHDIAWTIWDYKQEFGIFNKNSNELFDYDLNVPLLKALGFNVPPQMEYEERPLTSGFVLYDDFMGEGIQASSHITNGSLDYYNANGPKEGQYNIYWTGADQYDAIGFSFRPVVDLSLMPQNDYVLSFWVRGNLPGTSFDIRFVDTKTSATDRPWRMGLTIDEAMVPWDGEWHQISIPLGDLEEKGAWDDEWFEPEGKFDWSAIDQFEIVAEHGSMEDVMLYFDDIRISGEEIEIPDPITGLGKKENHSVFYLYPNPSSGFTNIAFSLSKSGSVQLDIFNRQGQKVRTLIDENQAAGPKTIQWNGTDGNGQTVAAGLYFVRLITEDGIETEKLLVVDR